MANIELVIKIPEHYYENNIKKGLPICLTEEQVVAILPKGHGRLIDAGKLLDSDGIIVDKRNCHYIPMLDVYQAPTIIEADKEGEQE